MIRHIIFDLDGTLIDSVGGLAYAMNQVLSKHQLPLHDLEAYKKWVGNGMKKLVERALPIEYITDKFVEECYIDMKGIYLEHWRQDFQVFEGITQMLDNLEREEYGLSVLSNKNQDMVQIIMKEYFSTWNFEGVFGAVNKETLKPNTQSVNRILSQLDWKPTECIIVGDSEIDIELSHNTGIPVIACTWGFRDRYFLRALSPDYLVFKPMDIVALLERLESISPRLRISHKE